MFEIDVMICFVSVDDVKQIFVLLQELVVFYECEYLVKMMVKDIIWDGFGEDFQFECVVVEVSGFIVGMGMF